MFFSAETADKVNNMNIIKVNIIILFLILPPLFHLIKYINTCYSLEYGNSL